MENLSVMTTRTNAMITMKETEDTKKKRRKNGTMMVLKNIGMKNMKKK